MKRSRWALCAALLLACTSGAQAAGENPIHVVNLMPAFFGAWDGGRGKPTEERVRLFKSAVLYPNRSAYDSDEFKLDDPHIAWYLSEVEPLIPEMRRVTAEIATELPAGERAFLAAFPDLRPVTVYFMPSLMHFDGQTRNGTLFFGLDGVIKFEGGNGDLGVLVTHELFHVYQFQVNPSAFGESGTTQASVAAQLWSEGLASYVSGRLNPKATRTQVLISPELAALSAENTKALACAIQPKLGSTRAADADPFFDAGVAPAGLPPRGGYLIGLDVAQELGATHSLLELALMKGAPLDAAIAAGVKRLCSG